MGVLSRSDVTVAPPRDLHLSPGMLGTLIRQPVSGVGAAASSQMNSVQFQVIGTKRRT